MAQRVPVPSDPTQTDTPLEASKNVGMEKKKNREGTTFRNQRVTFRALGTRTTIQFQDSDESYLCLENLNLERILKAIEDKPERAVWTVNGVFTEFRGENYVLINKAVVTPFNVATKIVPE